MSLHRCARCPRMTNGNRLICTHCDRAAYRKRTGFRRQGRPKAKLDLSPAEIEAIYQQALAVIRARRKRAA